MDKRYEKTEKAIINAYFQLLDKKEGGRISISELARKANIDRKTFYLHYDSVDEINRKFCANKAKEIVDKMFSQPLADDEIPVSQFLYILNEEISKRDTIFIRRIIDKKGMTYFFEQAQEELTNAVVERYHKLFPVTKERFRIYVDLYAAGILSVYMQWIYSNCPIPIEKLAIMINQAVNSGIQNGHIINPGADS